MENHSFVSEQHPKCTIPDILADHSSRYGSKQAIIIEASDPISHAGIWRQTERTLQQLNALGIGRGDRVAIVLPQGPELAVAFLTVASVATAAPLNPAFHQAEFEFYLKDLDTRALILMKDDQSVARSAAIACGIEIIELVTLDDGSFDLSGRPQEQLSPCGFSEPDDIALILHTSGTTSRPKMVPLTHLNLCASAHHISQTLELSDRDICLNIMPLFHIHGLVACVLASLAAGGTTICTRKFEASSFQSWLNSWKPTWYSAVPTMHQAILEELRSQNRTTIHSNLRLIRSSSAALPPTVMADLENAFRVPVIESYGMTEASHQMASNPLPPGARKPSCVGLPAGPEIAILNEIGDRLEHGKVGEIAIRGANVTKGYLGNPAANETAFHHGWLRTGDQGYFDPEGYLFISGRLKELINRGGEKISPREIDEVLLKHPKVKQAVAFAVPHPRLGEDIAAAVILHAQTECTEVELRNHVMNLMPAFKTPSRIIIVSDIPRGATGKIQRIGLADKLKDQLNAKYEESKTPTEKMIDDMFCEVLGCEPGGRQGNFFMLGGDSLRATQVIARLSKILLLELPIHFIFRLPTPALLGAEIDRIQSEREIDDLALILEGLNEPERAKLLD